MRYSYVLKDFAYCEFKPTAIQYVYTINANYIYGILMWLLGVHEIPSVRSWQGVVIYDKLTIGREYTFNEYLIFQLKASNNDTWIQCMIIIWIFYHFNFCFTSPQEEWLHRKDELMKSFWKEPLVNLSKQACVECVASAVKFFKIFYEYMS